MVYPGVEQKSARSSHDRILEGSHVAGCKRYGDLINWKLITVIKYLIKVWKAPTFLILIFAGVLA